MVYDFIKDMTAHANDHSLMCIHNIHNIGIHCANFSTNPAFMCELYTSWTDDNRVFVALGFQGNDTL